MLCFPALSQSFILQIPSCCKELQGAMPWVSHVLFQWHVTVISHVFLLQVISLPCKWPLEALHSTAACQGAWKDRAMGPCS